MSPTEPARRIITDSATLEMRARHEARMKMQAFFDDLYLTIATPHCGEAYKDAIRVVLKRAVAAGLYET